MSDISDGDDDSPSERTAIRRSVQSTAPQMKSRNFFAVCHPSRRYLVAYMAFLGFFNIYAMRVSLSVAIVAMTSNKTITNENEIRVEPAEFNWNPEIQGVVLSSFFYGYLLTQISGGYFAAIYGGKTVFGVGVAVTSLLALLTPLLAKYSLYLLVTARVMEGLFEGVTYPAMHAMWARWAPPLERSKLVMTSIAGAYLGTSIGFPSAGLIAYFGWPSVFYIFGALGYFWATAWLVYIKDKPQDDPKISEEELSYIRSTLRYQYPYAKVSSPVPWKRIFLSCPVWAIIVAHFSENWGFYTLLTELPTFMKDVYAYDLRKSGVMLLLPYGIMTIIVMLSGYLADLIRSKGILSTVLVRKLFSCTGFLLQSVFLLLVGYSSSPTSLLLCLIIAIGCGGLVWSGFGVNHLDIAPPYASLLMGVSNTFATLPGAISPLVTGYLVQNKSREEWQVVFYLASCIYLIGAIFYAIFASGEEQPWAHPDPGLFGDEESEKNEDLHFGETSCD